MNLIKKLTIAAGLLVSVASFAQTTATSSTTANGLLGQRFVDVGYSLTDISNYSKHGHAVGAAANLPVIPALLDVGASYSYSWVNGGLAKGHANTFGAYATSYTTVAGVKPFVSLGLGWQFTNVRFFGSDDDVLWGGQIGVEIPVGAFTITPRAVYSDDFESSRYSSQEWNLGAEVNYWVNAKTGVYFSAGKTDGRRGSADAWVYSTGLRWKF